MCKAIISSHTSTKTTYCNRLNAEGGMREYSCFLRDLTLKRFEKMQNNAILLTNTFLGTGIILENKVIFHSNKNFCYSVTSSLLFFVVLYEFIIVIAK